ncbi:GFA family protein [uncultured Piscinibacter sp.]|uniref:GFA family protein n=1 Tax=uncultured Piscinibacter sp. TaxID=1131835 RepID=UPI0026369422|nr:GFA family protein [uncultured Piscinibacter sp.]
MPKISGGCLCGAVKYTSAAEPVMAALCNCHHCQKQSGSAYSVNVAIPKGALQFTSEKPAVYEDTGSSGMPVYRHFCAQCGSPIFSDVVATPTLDWLKAGTLDDTSWVEPSVSIWCESAQAWVMQPQGMAAFAQNPPAV